MRVWHVEEWRCTAAPEEVQSPREAGGDWRVPADVSGDAPASRLGLALAAVVGAAALATGGWFLRDLVEQAEVVGADPPATATTAPPAPGPSRLGTVPPPTGSGVASEAAP